MGQDGLSNAVSLTVLLFHPVTFSVGEKVFSESFEDP